MGRRRLLFAILILAACAGDQPTEPTSEAEGSFFLAAPPPPPAPPTVLTGELGGGTGLGVSTELGFWESPVYATVTVDGALGYSGRPDGYLPGTGQIDAAGILVQNQCDLTVYVSFATSNGGATLPIAPTCWYPARNMGSYSRRMTLQGRVWTYRTAGPPLSCYKGVTPCVSYTGTQSVTVTPEEGHLILTPNKTVVAPGGGIYVTAKAVWTGDEKTAVPLTVREWRWAGSGAEVGGGHTKVCAIYNTNQCIVSVYQSGNVILEALVNGKVKTEQVWIAVQGGDTLPPPPPDSLPPNDSLPPTDTIPSGGGGGGGCSEGGAASPAAPYLVECEEPKPKLECDGSTSHIEPTRGAVVTCIATMSDGGPLAAVRWEAEPEDGPKITPVVGEAGIAPDGFSSTWRGPAILKTTVRAWVTPVGATAEREANSVEMRVSPRQWAPWEVGTRVPGTSRTVLVLKQLDGQYLPAPHIGSSTHPENEIVGFFARAVVDFRGEPVMTPGEGPNRGWSILTREYIVGAPFVYLHPDLFGGPWYQEQTGGFSPTGRYCLQQDIDRLAGIAADHEFTGSDSHLEHWNTALRNLDLQGRIERLMVFQAQPDQLEELANVKVENVYSRISSQEAAWDQRVYSRIFHTLGCDFDNEIGDGK